MISQYLLFGFIVLLSNSAGNDYPEIKDTFGKNNFSFEKRSIIDNYWKTSIDADGVIIYDSLNFTEGKYSVILTSKGMFKPFNACMFQYFSLPQEADGMVITIDSKSKNIEHAWLKTICFDENENMLSTDSVSILGGVNWKTAELTIETKGVKHVYIEINANSIDSYNGIKKLVVDNLRLGLNSYKESLTTKKIENKNIKSLKLKGLVGINITESTSYSAIEDLKKHKIIAVGESVHGSSECEKLAYELIKYQITNNNCKIVLREMSFFLGLIINNYISGVSNDNIEKLMEIYNFNVPEFMDFLDWVKVYNSETIDKVVFLGIDEDSATLNEGYFWKYLSEFKNANDSLKMTFNLIFNKEYDSALKFIMDYHTLKSLDCKTQKLIVHSLNFLTNVKNNPLRISDEERDCVQFQNTRFAINELLSDTSTAVIYSHLGHVNKKNKYITRINSPSFGSYMKKEFTIDYFVVAVLLGNGEITSTTISVRGYNCKLEQPVESSIEKICDTSSEHDFYYKISDDLTSSTCRIVGVMYSTVQFYPNSAKNRYDALIFLKNSTAYK